MRALPLLLLGAAAGAGEGLEAEVEAFVAAIREDGGPTPLTSRVDPDGLAEEIARLGIPADGLKETLVRNPGLLARLDVQFPARTIRLRKIEAKAGGAVAVVAYVLFP